MNEQSRPSLLLTRQLKITCYLTTHNFARGAPEIWLVTAAQHNRPREWFRNTWNFDMISLTALRSLLEYQAVARKKIKDFFPRPINVVFNVSISYALSKTTLNVYYQMKHWTSVTNITKHAGLVAGSWRRVTGLKEGFWGIERVFTCILAQRYKRPVCITTTVLTSPDYIRQVFNVFPKNIYWKRIYFSFFVCRDLSDNAIRRLTPRIFTGPSQLRILCVYLHFLWTNTFSMIKKVTISCCTYGVEVIITWRTVRLLWINNKTLTDWYLVEK